MRRRWTCAIVMGLTSLMLFGCGRWALKPTSDGQKSFSATSTISVGTEFTWIADLRDLWSDNQNSAAPGWRRALDRRWEQRCLAGAAALVTVSEPLADRLRSRYRGQHVATIDVDVDRNVQRVGGHGEDLHKELLVFDDADDRVDRQRLHNRVGREDPYLRHAFFGHSSDEGRRVDGLNLPPVRTGQPESDVLGALIFEDFAPSRRDSGEQERSDMLT